jgi:formimidoylglutamate deiminase
MKLFAEKILLSTGWATNKTLTIEKGIITAIEDGNINATETIQDIIIPGMVNCHSHAFQRAFAGFSEQGSNGQDSFWTWRKVMYQFLAQLSADDAEIIAQQLYIEMLKMGYTRVAEFHYLHHQADGTGYKPLTTMAEAIFKAAKSSGIGLTLLPVLYRFAGFGKQPPHQGQQRFINSTMQFNQLVTACFALSKQYANTNIGIAPHSLRAVDKDSMQAAVEHVRQLDTKAPIHIHISEQQQEVDDCIAYYGKRPVQWLLDNMSLDKYWCLIHATHIDNNELQGIVKAQAIAGICPTTEANLGDGIFPSAEFLQQKGTLAIGSDSHISVNPVEELRWLEYAQRLIKRQRAILANKSQPSVGLNLWQKAARGGAQSANANVGELALGKQADIVVLDRQQLGLFANDDQHLLDSFIFASQNNVVKDVMVNGVWVIKNKQHYLQAESIEKFTNLLQRLTTN